MTPEKKFVKKLDVPAVFDEIPTGIKTLSTLKKHEAERYSVWYNHFSELGKYVPERKSSIGWVGKHYKEIQKYIEDTYTPPEYTNSTLRNHLEGLANVLLAIDKDKFKEIVRPFYNRGLSIQQIVDKANEESRFTDKEAENFVPEEDLVDVRNKLEQKWTEDRQNLRLNMFHLILAVNTYIPPLRLNWIEMEIYPKRIEEGRVLKKIPKNAPAPPEDDKNYLWEVSPGKWAMVINYDKIENKRKAKDLPRQIIYLDDDIEGVTDGKKLNQIITKSLEYAPRNYPLIGIKTKQQMTASGYDSALKEMFKPKQPRQNLLRKAYVNYWHEARLNGKRLPESKLKEIASRMRHTLEVARGSYRKIDVIPREEEYEIVKSKQPVILPKVEPRPIPKIKPLPPEKAYFDLQAWGAEYRKTHHEEITVKRKAKYEKDSSDILKRKMLWNLNHGLVKRPNQKSIEKYGLEQDEETGEWISIIE